jgi:vitamin B12 transporter
MSNIPAVFQHYVTPDSDRRRAYNAASHGKFQQRSLEIYVKTVMTVAKSPRINNTSLLWSRLVIFIGTCTLIAIFAPKVNGQTDPHELEPVVVSATRADQKADDVAADVVVITRDQIDSIPVHNLGEALNYTPGLFIDSNGGLGSQATASIQGSLARQVSVFMDGVRLNMQANPIVDLSYLSLENVERIEVYRGGASSVWGSALGGVINIITPEPSGKLFSARTKAGAGGNQTYNAEGAADSTYNRLGAVITGSHLKTGGYIDHSAYRLDNLYSKLRYTLSPAMDVTFSLDYSDGKSQNPLPTIGEYYDESHKRRFFQTLAFRASPWDGVFFQFSGWHQRFTNRQDRNFIEDSSSVNNFDLVERLFGGSFKVVWETLSRNTLVAGFDGEWGNYDLSTLDRGTLSSGNSAAYVNDTLNAGSWTFTAGLRFDDNKDFGSELSPSFGIVHRFDKYGALARFQFARAYSAPPLNYLYAPDIGNPDLTPETGLSYQLGFTINPWEIAKFDLSLFWTDINDAIIFDQQIQKLVNVGEVTRRGFEASLNLVLPYGFSIFLGGTYVDIEDGRTHEKIKDMPGLIYDTSISHRFKDFLFQSLTGNYVWYNSSNPETRDNKFIFDYLIRGRLPYKILGGSLSLYGAAHNIFNSTRYLTPVFPNQARWFEAGLEFEF